MPGEKPIRLLEWQVKVGDWIKYGVPVAVYRNIEDPSIGTKSKEVHLKAKRVGRVTKLLLDIGQVAKPGYAKVAMHPHWLHVYCAKTNMYYFGMSFCVAFLRC